MFTFQNSVTLTEEVNVTKQKQLNYLLTEKYLSKKEIFKSIYWHDLVKTIKNKLISVVIL